jgi:membrane-associated phospholipid phosphatase
MSKLGAVIYIISIALFGLMSFFAHRFPYFPGDVAITRWFQGFSSPGVETAMQVLSSPLLAVLAGLIAAVLWLRGKRQEGFSLAAILGAALVIADLVKLFVNQPRPDDELVRVLTGLESSSFPSLHTAGAAAYSGLFIYLMPRLVERPVRRALAQGAAALLALLVGLSRICLGAHWASDVAGGLFLAGLLLYPAILLHNGYKGGEESKHARTA